MPYKRLPPVDGSASQSLANLEPTIVRHVLAEFRKQGMNAGPLFRGLGFDAASLESVDFLVSYSQCSRVVRRAMRLLNDNHLGLRLGSTFNLVAWGICLIGLMACADSRSAIEFAVDALPTIGCPLRLHVEDTEHGPCVVAQALFFDPEVTAFLVDETFSALVRASRCAVGPLYRPEKVELMAPIPPDTTLHHDVFQCPVFFCSAENRLFFPIAAVPVASADAVIAERVRVLMQTQARPASRVDEIEAVVVHAIQARIDAPPTLHNVAVSMHLSERTLRRRLSALGVTYAELLDRERRNRAIGLIRSGQWSLAEVAEKLGFVDSRSLRRAVKRWTGNTPSKIRAL